MARTFTPAEQQQKKQAFLSALGRGLSLNKSCKEINVTAVTIYGWKNADPVFAAAVNASLQKRPDRAPSRQPVARKAKDVPAEKQTDVIGEVCDALREGLPLDYACLLANICRGALRQWMVDDADVAARVNKAQAENMLFWIRCIRQGAQEDWKAAITYLERLYPAMFAEVKAVEMSVRQDDRAAGTVIDVTPESVAKRLAAMSDDELQAIIQREPK